MLTTYETLRSECPRVPCSVCLAPVKQDPSGRWFITLGHAGFNSRANNRGGYASREKAIAANRKYLRI